MPATYEPIGSVTLGSDTAFIEWTSIPQTYSDLVVVVSGRTSRTATADEAIGLRLNSDSANNYSCTWLVGNGASAISQRAANISYIEFSRMNPSISGNTTPSMAVAQIFAYSSTSVNKTVLGGGAASAEVYPISRYVGLWRSTAAVTTLRLIPAVGPNFVSGTVASLYGIKAA